MKFDKIGEDVILESAGVGSGGRNADIAVLSDGRLVVTWNEFLPQPTGEFDDTDGAVFARILDSDGAALSDIIQVNDFEPFRQDRAEVVALDAGSFAIGWTTTQQFGNTPRDSDTFIRFFDADGVPFNNFKLSFKDDNPVDRQQLHEIVALGDGLIAVILDEPDESGITGQVYNTGGDLYATLNNPLLDIARLNNGNIITAGIADDRPGEVGNVVRLTMYDSRLFAPKNIEGIIDPITFDLFGSSEDIAKSVEHLHIEALANGGFVVGFLEDDLDIVGGTPEVEGRDFVSTLKMVYLTEFGQIEFSEDAVPLKITPNSQKANFDMVALKGGGVAVAVTDFDEGARGLDIELLIFDDDGTLVSRASATDTTDGTQGQPSLVQKSNGNLVLAFEDLSDSDDTLASNTLRLAEFEISGKQARFIGTENDDTLRGAAGNDTIAGLGGDDEIAGRNGDDTLRGGAGDDTLNGGSGRDGLRGGDGQDNLKGGGGNDGLGGGEGADRMNGGGGDDIVSGGAGNDRLNGGGGDDLLRGGQGDDTLNGGAGADVFQFVRDRTGDDTVNNFVASEDSLLIDLRGAKKSSIEVSTANGDTLVTFGTASVVLDGVTLDESEISFLYI